MASPITQTMWLFLVSSAAVSAAGLDTRMFSGDFPKLAHVMYSVCGLSDLDISVSHPCAYSLFGMAYAFTECGATHSRDHDEFESCVLGCSQVDRCAVACADPEVRNPHCLANCKTVKDCVIKAAKSKESTGQVSANSVLSDCFAETPKTPEPAVIKVVSSPAASPAASPVAALVQSVGSPAPAVPPPPASPGAAVGVEPEFTPRKGTLSKRKDLVSDKCTCSKTGIINEVNTKQPGCAKHGKEHNAHVEAYCYVNGKFECGGSVPSTIFPGIFWVNCEKPNFHLLYPPTCEILKRAEAKLFALPPALGLKAPPESIENMTAPMDTLPNNGDDSLEKVRAGLQDWAKPLPALWHAQRGNYFAKEPFQNQVPIPNGGAPAAGPPAAGPPAAAGPAGPLPGGAAAPPAAAYSPAAAGAPMFATSAGPAAAFVETRLRGVQKHL